jgi:hypothetical protein
MPAATARPKRKRNVTSCCLQIALGPASAPAATSLVPRRQDVPRTAAADPPSKTPRPLRPRIVVRRTRNVQATVPVGRAGDTKYLGATPEVAPPCGTRGCYPTTRAPRHQPVTAPGRVARLHKAAARPLLVGILTPPNERYGNYR